jgi:hypothetical protein
MFVGDGTVEKFAVLDTTASHWCLFLCIHQRDSETAKIHRLKENHKVIFSIVKV